MSVPVLKCVSNQSPNRPSAKPSRGPVVLRQRRRPWRILPLALFAVIATTATMGAAAHVFWQASGHRYAQDVLSQQLNKIDSDVASIESKRPG